jgi:Transmembrane protein 231
LLKNFPPQFSHQDFNHDDVDDVMNFEISFERPAQSKLTSLSLYLELQASLRKICDFQVPAALMLYQLTPLSIPSQNFRLVGDLKLKQSTTLHCPYFMFDQKSHFHRTIINQNSSRLADYDLLKAHSKLVTNPAHFHFAEEFRTTVGDGRNDEFTLRLELNLPEVFVRYRKSFWRLIFEFWIQYLAVFVVLYVLADNFKCFLFKNSIFLTWKQVEGK